MHGELDLGRRLYAFCHHITYTFRRVTLGETPQQPLLDVKINGSQLFDNKFVPPAELYYKNNLPKKHCKDLLWPYSSIRGYNKFNLVKFFNLVNFEGTICNRVHFENLTGYNLKNLTRLKK